MDPSSISSLTYHSCTIASFFFLSFIRPFCFLLPSYCLLHHFILVPLTYAFYYPSIFLSPSFFPLFPSLLFPCLCPLNHGKGLRCGVSVACGFSWIGYQRGRRSDFESFVFPAEELPLHIGQIIADLWSSGSFSFFFHFPFRFPL